MKSFSIEEERLLFVASFYRITN